MATIPEALAKLATLHKILEAAQLLYSLKLIHKSPSTYVKKYVEDNPDINDLLDKNYGNN